MCSWLTRIWTNLIPRYRKSIGVIKAPKAASKNGPPLGVRWRSKSDIALIKRAAKMLNISFNTFVVDATVQVAKESIAAETNRGTQETTELERTA